MKNKKIKLLILITSCFIFLFTLFSGISYVFASAQASNSSAKSNYLNLYKNGIYNDTITVSSLSEANGYYFPCETNNYSDEDKTDDYSDSLIGFKINNEFFTNATEISEDGTYTIEVYNYEETNHIRKKVGSVPFENFKITLSINDKPKLLKSKFYLNNYNNYDSFKNDLVNSFEINESNVNEKISFSSKENSALQSLFNKYKAILNNDEQMETSNFEEQDVSFKITYNGKEYNYDIKFCKLTSEETKNFVNLNDLASQIMSSERLILSQNSANYFDNYSRDTDLFKYLININHYYETVDGEILYYTFNNFKVLSNSSTGGSVTNNKITCQFIISNNLNQMTSNTFSLAVASYDFNNTPNKDAVVEFKNDNIELEYGSTKVQILNSIKEQIKNFYVKIPQGSSIYKDYSYRIKNIEVTNDISLNKNDYANIVLTFENIMGESFSTNIIKEYKVVEPKAKILQKYNYIVLDDIDDTKYQNEQIRIYYKNENYRINDSLIEKITFTQNTSKGNILIEVKLTNGQEISKTIPYYVKLKQSGFKSFLISYGNFLRGLF